MSQRPQANAVVDQLRARWQVAIAELGPAAAAEDAAQAFATRSSYSLEEARRQVILAWKLLALSGFA